MADIDMLRLVSLRSGLGIKYVSKEGRITAMLNELAGAFGAREAVLKGGTAINRVHIKKRFSEDIDLDTTLSKNAIERRMRKIKGFDIGRARLMGKVLRYDCYYANEFGEKDRIMAEFNRMEAIKAAEKPRKAVINSFIFPAAGTAFAVYSLEDLLAQKMKALSTREDGKDVFDLFYALDLKYRRKVLEKALRLHGLGSTAEVKEVLKGRLEGMKLKSKYIGNSTNHYIPVGLRPDWKAFIDTLASKIERV
jgi:predicted nucleotidyltransferase component of viral defense system